MAVKTIDELENALYDLMDDVHDTMDSITDKGSDEWQTLYDAQQIMHVAWRGLISL